MNSFAHGKFPWTFLPTGNPRGVFYPREIPMDVFAHETSWTFLPTKLQRPVWVHFVKRRGFENKQLTNTPFNFLNGARKCSPAANLEIFELAIHAFHFRERCLDNVSDIVYNLSICHNLIERVHLLHLLEEILDRGVSTVCAKKVLEDIFLCLANQFSSSGGGGTELVDAPSSSASSSSVSYFSISGMP
jgi:hypothetical protein